MQIFWTGSIVCLVVPSTHSLLANLRCLCRQRFIALHPAVAQLDHACAVARVFFRMRYLHDGRSRAVQFTEKFHNFARLRGMQIAGWFVGQQQFRRVNHGARNAHQLLLPAGELRGKQIFFGDNT